MTPPANFNYTEGSTSVNQVWRNSYWDVGFSNEYAWNKSVPARRETARDVQ